MDIDSECRQLYAPLPPRRGFAAFDWLSLVTHRKASPLVQIVDTLASCLKGPRVCSILLYYLLDSPHGTHRGSYSSHGTHRGSLSSHGTHQGSHSSHGTRWVVVSTSVLSASVIISLAVMNLCSQMTVISYSCSGILGVMFFTWNPSGVMFLRGDHRGSLSSHGTHQGSHSSHGTHR